MFKKIISTTLACTLILSTVMAQPSHPRKTFIIDNSKPTTEATTEPYVYGSSKQIPFTKNVHCKNQNAKSKQADFDWNKDIIHANASIPSTSNRVKVAILDSGIDYLDDIDVYCKRDFIDNIQSDEDSMLPLFEDLCGHGSSVAGIIAAKDNSIGITGINPNVQLYSARILDEECKAPISRVVDAIYWAIENKVNIINISFGTTTDSEALHKAIKDAYKAGILIIAAAGNQNTVEFPAAYDEVIAVGSIDSTGKICDYCANGSQLELVAPGEQIVSSGAFDGTMVSSGTSMAAPHVTGVASVLWQKDLSCSNEFIRQLLAYSSNLYGLQRDYGYGLVDLTFALDHYDEFKEKYKETQKTSTTMSLEGLKQNTAGIETYDENNFVTGTWTGTHHQTIADYGASGCGLTSNQLTVLKTGAVWSDREASGLQGMTAYPQFHGYYQGANFLASYIYLTRVAAQSGNSVSYSYTPRGMNIFTNQKVNGVAYTSASSIINSAWNTYNKNRTTANKQNYDTYVKLFIYGMAIHQASDIFAHSSYKKFKDGIYRRVKHSNAFTNDQGLTPNGYDADNINIPGLRYTSAKQVAKATLSHYKNKHSTGYVSDFALSTYYYDGQFYIYNMKNYANAIGQGNSALDAVDLATKVNSKYYIVG